MRQLLSILSLILAGLLAAAALAGYQADQLLRDEEPIREIAGELPEQSEFSEAVASTMVSELSEQIPDQARQLLGTGIEEQAEAMVSDIVASLLENDRTRAAWDETLQSTRTDWTAQMEELFDAGSTGSAEELNVEVDLSPVASAMTEPLREGLDSYLGWIPGLDSADFDVLAPEIVVDVDAAAGQEAQTDPYAVATVVAGSEHWLWFAVGSGLLLVLGLVIGVGKSRWAGLAAGGLVAGVLGLWLALSVAAPSFDIPPDADPAMAAVLQHVEESFTAWAQPSWWIFIAGAALLLIIGVLGSLVAPGARRVEARA
ncbi:hypothetical protein [Nesterenkonia sp. NBAIMH1]|uniref:hypothetical protein n=1 Tax=Nesterenkonia sp. NBAIMH1 TaxID=2600320 RepID=UPI0011B7A88D|nr:hypothetical protein [Nesterenkonia sp. NBAIMH1]